MKALHDPGNLLETGLTAIREQFAVPDSYPPQVLAAAERAARRPAGAHVDRTDLAFVTLDPATSTDLDQAFAIETSGSDLILRYAIADVPWFVEDGDPLDLEAWKRGTTTYLPDGKAGLYPPALSEQAASLLPDGPRPAIVHAVRVLPDGSVKLDGVERSLVRSRAKLAYDAVRDDQVPAGFAELARRVEAAADARGAARVDPPEQEVERNGDGRFVLRFRPQLPSERRNAALSLATNLAVADALLAAGTGLFRVMAPPDAKAEGRLRRTAQAFGLHWPTAMPLSQFERRLHQGNPREAAFMLAIRRAGNGASYAPWRPGDVPWHAAMAASYVHCTAPLRRLADRYVLRAILAVANGQPVPDAVTQAFERLPDAMGRADTRDSRIERAIVDLAEIALLAGHVGRVFPAVVTDVEESAARIQLRDLPVVARARLKDVLPGTEVRVRLTAVDPDARRLTFEQAA